MTVSSPGSPSRLQLPPGPWTTLLDGLCARFPKIPREQWLDRFARGLVQQPDGTALSADLPYRVGMQIRYFREVADEQLIPFEEQLLHVDEHIVIADKPHFLPVTPAGQYVHETLLARLIKRLANPDLVPMHRIDGDTAGLVMFSACPSTRDHYQSLFRERRIEKEYLAIAPALPALQFPLIRKSRLVTGTPFFRSKEVDGAPNSESRVDVLARLDPWWHYSLKPVSGRTHQLRVHMAALGAPIRNDPFYPDLRFRERGDFSDPLQLLARSLRFVDPLSGDERCFESQRMLAFVE